MALRNFQKWVGATMRKVTKISKMKYTYLKFNMKTLLKNSINYVFKRKTIFIECYIFVNVERN